MARLTAPPSRLAPAGTTEAPGLARGSARRRGYTAAWDRASKAFLRDHPLCRGCEAMGWVELSRLTDHVIPHRGNMRRFWDEDWWQACCEWHHNVVKQVLERKFEAGEIGADDLWLDSAMALEVAARVLAGEGG